MFLFIMVILSLTAVLGTDASDGCQQCTLPTIASCGPQLLNTTKFVSDNGELHRKGAGDKADALTNFRDSCNGDKAKRSTYCCKENGTSTCAPGSSVCVDNNLLLFLHDSFSLIQKVISIVGGCHVNNTSSYDGQRAQVVFIDGSEYIMVQQLCNNNLGILSEGPSFQSHMTYFCDFTSPPLTTQPLPTTVAAATIPLLSSSPCDDMNYCNICVFACDPCCFGG